MIKIRVPATSANIGPGFDVMGIAFDLYNEFTFYEGEMGEHNLIYDAYEYTFKYLRKEPVPARIEVDGQVPMARGLGSSSTCIVAGVAGALAMLKWPMDRELIIRIATAIEGHPDNVAPATLGGLVVSVMADGEVHSELSPVDENIGFIAIIPDFELPTEEARAILPKEISLQDGIYNVSRACLLSSALRSGVLNHVRVGLSDRFHEPWRMHLIPGFMEVKQTALGLGALGCYLSGAGPTIMCVTGGENGHILEGMTEYIEEHLPKWKVVKLNVDLDGFTIIRS